VEAGPSGWWDAPAGASASKLISVHLLDVMRWRVDQPDRFQNDPSRRPRWTLQGFRVLRHRIFDMADSGANR
jgi:hypothetical protein